MTGVETIARIRFEHFQNGKPRLQRTSSSFLYRTIRVHRRQPVGDRPPNLVGRVFL